METLKSIGRFSYKWPIIRLLIMFTSTITLPSGIGAGTYLFTVMCAATGCQQTVPIDIGTQVPTPVPTPTPVPVPTPGGGSYQPITSTPPSNGEAWLDNGTVKVRVNLNCGAVIDWFGYTSTNKNVINRYVTGNSVRPQDVGRQKGAAPYTGPAGGPDPANAYFQDGQSTQRVTNGVLNGGIGYNVVQGGDEDRNPSDVVAYGQANGVIYSKTLAYQWGMVRVPGHYYIEQWVWLQGSTVRTHYRITGNRPDQTQWEARANEFSYCYVTANFTQMWATLKNSNPERIDQWLSSDRGTGNQQTTWQKDYAFHSGEPWIAAIDPFTNSGVGYVNMSGFGDMQIKSFGIDNPNQAQTSSDAANESMYIASTPQLIIDYNLDMQYDDAIVLGNLGTITSTARTLISGVDNRPHAMFTSSRNDVFYHKGKDTGKTPPGRLVASFTDKRFEVHTQCRPFSGSDVPTLYVKFKYTGSESQLRLRWKQVDQTEAEANAVFMNDPQNDQRAEFAVQSGVVQTIAIPLNSNTNWNGKKIAKFKFTRVTLPASEQIQDITIPEEHLEIYGWSYKPENQW